MKTGWQIKKLSEVCEKITDGTHQTPTYFDKGFLFLSSRNVTSGKIDWENIKYIDSKQHVDMQKRVSPRLNDILLAKNGTTGVAAMVDREVPFDIYVSLALLRPLPVVLPSFLLHFINSPLAKQQFTSKRLKGIGVPNLHSRIKGRTEAHRRNPRRSAWRCRHRQSQRRKKPPKHPRSLWKPPRIPLQPGWQWMD
jgi:type I restriction enzyme, S subunit